jgi:mannosyltransferase OCH1-like enzyme
METIPKIIHRVHMGPKDPFAEYFWETSKMHNIGWGHITHDDSNLEEYPLIGRFLSMSPAFAFKSDLMRLEILYHTGGIYIDTDIEVIRPFDHFLEYRYPFAAWESNDTIGSAVIGSPPKNPQVLDLILYCIGAIETESSDGKITYGGHLKMFSPSVITKLWRGNPEVMLLQPESFYPYHWTEKDRATEDFSVNQNTFAIHHWSGSWTG